MQPGDEVRKLAEQTAPETVPFDFHQANPPEVRGVRSQGISEREHTVRAGEPRMD